MAPRRPALEAERAFLFRSLDDLEDERDRGEIDGETFERLHDDYVARAARVVRSLDGIDSPREAAPRASTSRRRVMVAVGVVVAGLGAGLVVARTAGERQPGEFITGEQFERSSTARLVEAQQLFQEGEVLAALQAVDGILEDDPDDLAARTWRGWILVSVPDDGLLAQGSADLDAVLQIDPTNAEALLFRAATHRAQGELEQSLALYERLLALPDDLPMRPVVEGLVDELRTELG